MALLKVDHLTTGYGGDPVVHDVTINVHQSEMVLLVGSNGSGKSTLMKAIYGLLRPSNFQGTVHLDQMDITRVPPFRLLDLGIVYIPQKDNVYETMTVQENLETSGLALRDKGRLRSGVEQAYDLFPRLGDLRKRRPFNLSGGERQMLALAMGTIHRPKLMLLDEPCAGLGPQSVHEILSLVDALKRDHGIGLLVIEHRVRESLDYADRVVALKLGSVQGQYTPGELLGAEVLHAVFL